MIKHIVLWRLKNKADVARVKQELESMRGKIPGLLSLEVGVNFAESSPVDLGLYTEFSDRAALNAYSDHPVHVPVKQAVGGLIQDRWVLDYEV
ncbi:stress responsive protein [Steroidobacter agaridevorans]|uniref:Stress responsive protein n=1 Tax=Steroidobacter agaridevorans TaxID=2695856 RepID=A0A829YMC9_9GAMM|nr:Dabb family protein [Steroidobacter agaridevorans]GFE83868.1 stress responsive protein [Steroidobacter agaridevorans]GFE91545.1 stress responsive protein [Steroidobacter agaridevorans]